MKTCLSLMKDPPISTIKLCIMHRIFPKKIKHHAILLMPDSITMLVVHKERLNALVPSPAPFIS